MLERFDISRSLAIDPQARYFVLGTSYKLQAFDAVGKSLWERQVPGEVWAVNISNDGRLVVAAYQRRNDPLAPPR